MSFERDYDKILAHAKRKVKFFGLDVEPEELVNDAYIELFSLPYSLELFLKNITNNSLKENYDKPIENTFGKHSHKASNAGLTQDDTCKKCKQTLPAAAFKVIVKPNGARFTCKYCTDCFKEYRREYVNKRYKDPRFHQKIKEQNLRGYKKWAEKNRKKRNDYQKQRDLKEKISLGDNYIKKVLRAKYSTEFINAHPELILETRERIMQKRFAKSKK